MSKQCSKNKRMDEMNDCRCGLGIESDHESRINDIKRELNRVRWSKPHKEAKPIIISLMEENIRVMRCLDKDISKHQEKLIEYKENIPINAKTQLGPRKMNPGAAKPKKKILKLTKEGREKRKLVKKRIKEREEDRKRGKERHRKKKKKG